MSPRRSAIAEARRDVALAREGIAAGLPGASALCLLAAWRTAACARGPVSRRLADRWFATFLALTGVAR